MSQSEDIGQPYKGQKFPSFEHLKKYLEEYGQKNYVKFWIRSSHTRNSHKSKISKTMNPDLKYVSVKFACIFGGEKIRCRSSGIRKSYTYRNLGCPCVINAVVGEDGNHVKLDTVILQHNHALCKTLYDSLKKTKRKNQHLKSDKGINQSGVANSDKSVEVIKNSSYVSEVENLSCQQEWLESEDKSQTNFRDNGIDCGNRLQFEENCLKDIEDRFGKNAKILVINPENENYQFKNKSIYDEITKEDLNFYKKGYKVKENSQICRLCLSSKHKLSPIFNPNLPLESTVLSFKIMGCASIEISSNDGLPNNICTACEANLDVAYNFRVRCEKSDSILREVHAKSESLKKECENYLGNENSNEENSQEETILICAEGNEGIEESHRLSDVSTQEPVYLQFAISCPVCSAYFETYESMLEHLGDHTDEETFLLACNFCFLVCPSVKDLQEHMGKHLKESRIEMWACGICDASFESAEELKTHENNHEVLLKPTEIRTKKQISEVKYLCNVCGKIFKTKDRFQAHRNMHEGLRPHVCFECGRGFADRKNLQQHYDVVHLRKVRHECPICQRKFYTRTKMKSHMTMHSGDKPFTCDVCNKTFRLKMNMNKHKKTHTNDRPYKCDKCNAAFIEKNLLKRHSYKHGGVRPFLCPVCGHGFAAKFCLKKHLKDSKCRGVVIADPENYQWMGVEETDANTDSKKCVVVYKAQEDRLTEESEAIDLNILNEYKDESNS